MNYPVYRKDMQDLTSHVILKVLKIAVGLLVSPPQKSYNLIQKQNLARS